MSEKNNVMQIKIINNSMPKEKYKQIKEYLKGLIEYLCKTCLPWDFKLIIRIVKNKVNSKTLAAAVIISENEYRLYLTESSVDALYNGRKKFFISVFLHELAHIRDYGNAFRCKYSLYNMSKNNSFTKNEFFVKKGFCFWSELNAFYLTYNYRYKYDNDSPTMFKSVQGLGKVSKKAGKICRSRKKCNIQSLIELKATIDEFTYDLTKLLADAYLNGLYCGYSKKVKKSYKFKYLNKFLTKVSKIIRKINKNPFNKKFEPNFVKLGKLIYTSFYLPFGIDLLIKNNKCQEAYFFLEK